MIKNIKNEMKRKGEDAIFIEKTGQNKLNANQTKCAKHMTNIHHK